LAEGGVVAGSVEATVGLQVQGDAESAGGGVPGQEDGFLPDARVIGLCPE